MSANFQRNTLILFAIISSHLFFLVPTKSHGMELFQVKLVELDNDARLIATSNSNFAIVSPKLAANKSWRTVSVNGDKVLIVTSGGERQRTTRANLGEKEMAAVEALRDEMANSNSGAYSQMSTASGGGVSGGFMMSSNSAGTGMASSSSMSSSSSYSPSSLLTSSLFGGGEMSYSMKDENNFSVSRSDLPFSWSRIFINGDLVTTILKNGDVEMVPMEAMEADQLEAIKRITAELMEIQRTQQRQISNTLQHSMDMVSNVFNSIMASFPKPPSYQSAVGNMFGNNFPFGSKNSPFAGWPFGSGASVGVGGGGAAAVAVAGRR